MPRRPDADNVELAPRPRRYPTRTPSPDKSRSTLDIDQTPRPVPPIHASAAPDDPIFEDDEDSTRRSDTDSRTSNTSLRSSSPVKRVAALRHVAGGVFYHVVSAAGTELGEECKEFWDKLQEVDAGVGIIPDKLQKDETFSSRMGRPVYPFYLFPDDRSLLALQAELDEIYHIMEASRRCSMEHDSEAEWNSAVHTPALRLAFGRDETEVCFRYVPTDKINPKWLPPHASGLATGSRMVDYVVLLNGGPDPLITRGDHSPTLSNRIVEASAGTSINHVKSSSIALQHRPIAVSVETKTISRTKEEARVQLAVWAASQVGRLHAFANIDVLARMVFPLIFVQADTWSIMFARCTSSTHKMPSARVHRLDQLNIYEERPLGDTKTVMGIYKLLNSLRIVRNWVNGTYRKWWEELLPGESVN